MMLKNRILSWVVENRRNFFVKRKGVAHLDIGSDNEFLDIHAEMVRDERAIQSLRERYNIYYFVKSTSGLDGAVAEVGVYRGGSAKLICKAKGKDPLHLFDTFEGLPSFDQGSEGVFSSGDFNDTSSEEVQQYLSAFENVHCHKGFFPDSALNTSIENMHFRFVHLDVDIYESTLKALEFFYPRMVKGGVIISHDYKTPKAPGVKRAYDSFFQDKPETVIPIWDSQCVIVKI